MILPTAQETNLAYIAQHYAKRKKPEEAPRAGYMAGNWTWNPFDLAGTKYQIAASWAIQSWLSLREKWKDTIRVTIARHRTHRRQ